MIIIYIILAIILIILFTWERSPFRIYWKSEARRAFTRTGFGGAKAILGRGAFVIPLLHKIQWVDLGETKLVVKRKEKEAVITKNLLRADIEAEFFIRVKADKESVRQAATALGRRAENSDGLRDFLEPKLLDALQAVASQITLEEIHENRTEFSKRIKELLREDLQLKGLEISAASLCSLDQTAIEFYNPNNIFDSEGLLAIKEQTEKRRKLRNDIEQSQALSIEQKNVDTRKQFLELEKDRSSAEEQTHKEIEAVKEERARELTQFRLEQHKQSEEARILQEQYLRDKELTKERYLEEKRIAKEREVELAEIKKSRELEESRIGVEKAIQTAAIQREIDLTAEKRKREEVNIELEKTIEMLKIARERALEEERISKEMDVEMAEVRKQNQVQEERIHKQKTTQLADIQRETELTLERQKQELADIAKMKAVEVAKVGRQTAIFAEEKANALAQVEVNKARTQQEASEQEMLTVRMKSQAERQKLVSLIRAEEEAARQKIEKAITVDTQAYEIQKLALARYESAENEAQAMERLAKATQKEVLVKAAGEQAMIEARNLISEHILKNETIRKLIDQLAPIAGELMKPAEKIDSIKIIHVDGIAPAPLVQPGEVGEEQSLLSYGGARSAIGAIINGILQIGAFKPVFRELFGTDVMGEVDYDRFVKALKEIAPGLVQQAGRELIKDALHKEQERKEKVENREASKTKDS